MSAGESSGGNSTGARNVVRLSRLASILAGLAWFAGFTRVLAPVIGQMGGHVIPGFAGLPTLLALAGLFARVRTRAVALDRLCPGLCRGGGVLGRQPARRRLARGVRVRLFAVGILALMAGMLLLGFGVLRTLPAWSIWPLMVGWATFLPMANLPVVFGLAFGATNVHSPGYLAWALSSAGLLGAGWVTLGYALWMARR